jgi:hypothetical protein
MVKLPVPVTPALNVSELCVFFAWMLAVGTTAPVGSETVPVMVPRSDCANANGAIKSTPKAHNSFFICPPILFMAHAAIPKEIQTEACASLYNWFAGVNLIVLDS